MTGSAPTWRTFPVDAAPVGALAVLTSGHAVVPLADRPAFFAQLMAGSHLDYQAVLVTSLVVGTLMVAALLGILSVRRPSVALLIVGILAVVAVAAAFAQPGVAAAATILTVIGALAAGCAVTSALTSAAGLAPGAEKSAPDSAAAGSVNDPDSPVVRSREAHSGRGTAVGRAGFLLLSGGAAAAGLAAVGVGRLLAGQNAPEAAAPKKLKIPEAKQASNKSSGEPEEAAAKKFQAHMEKMQGLYEKIQLSKNTDERRFLKHEYMLEMQEGTKLFGLMHTETAGHPHREIKKQSTGTDSPGALVMTDGERLRSLERRMGMTEQMMERMMERQSMEEK